MYVIEKNMLGRIYQQYTTPMNLFCNDTIPVLQIVNTEWVNVSLLETDNRTDFYKYTIL